jgi:hypothetical protein
MFDLTVEAGDILRFRADIVLLKYAQSFHGADSAVAAALGDVGVGEERLRPRPGAHAIVATGGAIAAPSVCYFGVPWLSELGYRQIREFAVDALAALARDAPDTRHLAMTVHGPGYGLDESEAIRSLLAGLVDALRSGGVPRGLSQLTLVERNVGRVGRLRTLCDQMFGKADYAARLAGRWGYRLAVETPAATSPAAAAPSPHVVAPARTGTVEEPAEDRPHAFVAMPFGKDTDDVFYYGIQGPVHAAGLLCERVDQAAFTGDIVERIKQRIATATVVIAELTAANPNVYLEVGYAWGRNRPTILLVRDLDQLRFDVRGHRCLIYERIRDLEEQLTRELARLPKVASARP